MAINGNEMVMKTNEELERFISTWEEVVGSKEDGKLKTDLLF